ncbi:MAG: hypothetical protein K2W85_01445 [Phycisphaerales bacterium]|nr:hypothetical protein [Phycisphaerales bacterium]
MFQRTEQRADLLLQRGIPRALLMHELGALVLGPLCGFIEYPTEQC